MEHAIAMTTANSALARKGGIPWDRSDLGTALETVRQNYSTSDASIAVLNKVDVLQRECAQMKRELHTMSETLEAHFAKQDGSMRRVMNQVKAFSRSAERRD